MPVTTLSTRATPVVNMPHPFDLSHSGSMISGDEEDEGNSNDKKEGWSGNLESIEDHLAQANLLPNSAAVPPNIPPADRLRPSLVDREREKLISSTLKTAQDDYPPTVPSHNPFLDPPDPYYTSRRNRVNSPYSPYGDPGGLTRYGSPYGGYGQMPSPNVNGYSGYPPAAGYEPPKPKPTDPMKASVPGNPFLYPQSPVPDPYAFERAQRAEEELRRSQLQAAEYRRRAADWEMYAKKKEEKQRAKERRQRDKAAQEAIKRAKQEADRQKEEAQASKEKEIAKFKDEVIGTIRKEMASQLQAAGIQPGIPRVDQGYGSDMMGPRTMRLPLQYGPIMEDFRRYLDYNLQYTQPYHPGAWPRASRAPDYGSQSFNPPMRPLYGGMPASHDSPVAQTAQPSPSWDLVTRESLEAMVKARVAQVLQQAGHIPNSLDGDSGDGLPEEEIDYHAAAEQLQQEFATRWPQDGAPPSTFIPTLDRNLGDLQLSEDPFFDLSSKMGKKKERVDSAYGTGSNVSPTTVGRKPGPRSNVGVERTQTSKGNANEPSKSPASRRPQTSRHGNSQESIPSPSVNDYNATQAFPRREPRPYQHTVRESSEPSIPPEAPIPPEARRSNIYRADGLPPMM